MYKVAFLHPQFDNAAGEFARHAIFGYLYFSLDSLCVLTQREKSYQGNNDDHYRESHHGKEYVVMLFL